MHRVMNGSNTSRNSSGTVQEIYNVMKCLIGIPSEWCRDFILLCTSTGIITNALDEPQTSQAGSPEGP